MQWQQVKEGKMVFTRVCKKCQKLYRTEKRFSQICFDCIKESRELKLRKTLGFAVVSVA